MQTRLILFLGLLGLIAAVGAGCQTTPQQYLESLKGDGFTNSPELGGNLRGANPNARHSGFFTDRRSEQIEQSLGGGF